MKNTDWIITGLTYLIMGVILCGFIFAAYWLQEWRCTTKWEDSGMDSRFKFQAGCQIQREDGTWIPEENFREQQQ